MASLALMTNCPNERGASCRSKASLNSSSPIKLSKPATASSTIRSQTREVRGKSVTVIAGVKLDEFDDISPHPVIWTGGAVAALGGANRYPISLKT